MPGILNGEGSYAFDVRIKDEEIEKYYLNNGGMHNVENAVAAISCCKFFGR
jgi:UDP-N-acetylmuramate-alanine ligase